MKCPACSQNLIQINTGGLVVDVCQEGCGGIWFDNRELQQVDEAHEFDLEPLLNIRYDLGIEVDYRARRECPRCPGVILMRQGYAGSSRIQVDRCATCGGFWLDGGELAQIRNLSAGQGRQEAAAELRRTVLASRRAA
jgi:Zn-finger nucleic acid-binding protein